MRIKERQALTFLNPNALASLSVGVIFVLLLSQTMCDTNRIAYADSTPSRVKPIRSAKRFHPTVREKTADLTALVVDTALRSGDHNHPCIVRGLRSLNESLADNGPLTSNGRETFATAHALMALTQVNSGGQIDKLVTKLCQRLIGLQKENGGWGANAKSTPDLHNTALAIEASVAAGAKPSASSMRSAVNFVSSCQLMENAGIGTSLIGGFVATPINDATVKSGSPIPCGSTTCAGLNALLLAGVDYDDARIRTAVKWLGQHYTLTGNPGMRDPQRGLYCYYLNLAKTLKRLPPIELVKVGGDSQKWQQAIIEAVVERQQSSGEWSNPRESENKYESDSTSITCHAIQTICQFRKDGS